MSIFSSSYIECLQKSYDEKDHSVSLGKGIEEASSTCLSATVQDHKTGALHRIVGGDKEGGCVVGTQAVDISVS